ncbi:MAG: hypothetical protein JO101_00985 [Candidatus Eremiobacteraeota bacterium]|nr:hypothetical protein [Candidatus Eremiobacteraeota bacterium]MBV8353865.1 hypothetical protein [Candidatus Eremiobacteraeota bacterium]
MENKQLARRLETLDPGTPVYCGEKLLGTLDGVYAEGSSDLPEYLVVRWEALDNTPVLVPTKDVESLEARGVILMGVDPGQYDVLPKYQPELYPKFRRLR